MLFRRTALTSAIPDPVRDGDGLAALTGLLNTDDSTFRLLTGWMISALIPEIPHPILAFKGEQGTGKTTAARSVVQIIDPSPAPLRTAPRDVKQWVVVAAASWAVCLDNVNAISSWLSETLCRAVTGDGNVDRALYTDDDVTVLAFRRVVMMTSIDAGDLDGDLAERLLLIELQPMQDGARRTDAELTDAYLDAQPSILASLLDLTAEVLERLPDVRPESMPRMADFACVLQALDDGARTAGTRSAPTPRRPTPSPLTCSRATRSARRSRNWSASSPKAAHGPAPRALCWRLITPEKAAEELAEGRHPGRGPAQADCAAPAAGWHLVRRLGARAAGQPEPPVHARSHPIRRREQRRPSTRSTRSTRKRS